MFNLFRKKPLKIPEFNDLKESDIKDKYFSRTCPWDRLEDNIVVYDINSPRVITMDPWPQHIFLSATGLQSISDFVFETAKTYSRKEGIPEELDKTVLHVIQSLLDDSLIELHDEAFPIPDHLQNPRKKS